jgi:hypothetical protein
VLLGNGYNYQPLPATERAMNDDLIARLDDAMGLRGLAADVNLAVPAGLLRLRSGLEEAGDIEPEIEAHTLVQS